MVSIRPASNTDVAAMVALSKAKRLAYEQAQPVFWKYAKDAEIAQEKYFLELLNDHNHISLVTEKDENIQGFIIGKLVPAPAVYDPRGLTLLIDDFCVSIPKLWPTIGATLLTEIKKMAKIKGAVQTLIICGTHDAAKNEFLKSCNLRSVTQLYNSSI